MFGDCRIYRIMTEHEASFNGLVISLVSEISRATRPSFDGMFLFSSYVFMDSCLLEAQLRPPPR